MKKIFIKLARLLGYEIIDQNNFVSPSLEKELNVGFFVLIFSDSVPEVSDRPIGKTLTFGWF